MAEDITVVPAYGRDYRSLAAAKADWSEGKDFLIVSGRDSGRYLNKADADQYGVGEVWLRYKAQSTKARLA